MNLKQFRTDYRLTQQELADVFKCLPSNISNIEGGRRNVTKEQLKLLIDTYGRSAVEPYCEAGEIPPYFTPYIMEVEEFEKAQQSSKQIVNNVNTKRQVSSKSLDLVGEMLRRQQDQLDRYLAMLENSVSDEDQKA